jgi:hypothetical protein
MHQSQLRPAESQYLQIRPIRPRASRILASTIGPALAVLVVVLMRPSQHLSVPVERYSIPLAPSGSLSEPVNFGYRCTLVDAAAVLDLYGASISQSDIAARLSNFADYSDAGHGIPWWAYIALPGQRPLLDKAIERVGRQAGRNVVAHTYFGLNFDRVAAAIAAGHPVILNVLHAPDGTFNHSLLAYGFDTRGGHALLLAIDPNTQVSYWIGPRTLWSQTITSTFIMPAPER